MDMTSTTPEPDDEMGTLIAIVDLALDGGSDAPAGLRLDVLAQALGQRAAGDVIGRPEPSSPQAAFAQTVEDFHELVGSLSAAEWQSPPTRPPHAHIGELVAHLAGMEALSRAWLVGPAPDANAVADHLAATAPMVAELGQEPGPVIAERWYDLARQVVAAAASVPTDLPVLAHDLPTDAEGLLVLRTFELWAHMHDVAAATGRPTPDLDAPRMALMSERFMTVLPFAVAMRGMAAPGRTARFVLTGPAGGCYSVALDPSEAPGEPDTTIVVDATQLCRLAARRIEVADLPVTIEGDLVLAGRVLASADALAKD
jgi:uncharacterized protein (TIGR03083 family)